jgi:hypothetical protein
MKEQGKEGQLFSLNLGPRHMKISEVELEKVHFEADPQQKHTSFIHFSCRSLA